MGDTQSATDAINESESKVSNEIETIGAALLPAFISWLKMIFYFLILPYKVWKTTTIRLAKSSSNGGAIVKNDEEFPIFTYFKASFDATIFMSGIVAVLFILVALVKGVEALAASFFVYVFFIPIVAFFNEVLSMRLVAVQKTIEIAKNTKK